MVALQKNRKKGKSTKRNNKSEDEVVLIPRREMVLIAQSLNRIYEQIPVSYLEPQSSQASA